MDKKRSKGETEMTDTADGGRRKILQSAVLGGGAALTALPTDWQKPVVSSLMLPAHANTTEMGGLGSVSNCPDGYSISTSAPKYSDGTPITIVVENGTISDGGPDEIFSVVGGTLVGGTVLSETDTSDQPCADGSTLTSNFSYSFTAGSGTLSFDSSISKYCGDNAVLLTGGNQRLVRTGSNVSGTSTYLYYDGTGNKYIQYCTYLIPESFDELQQRSIDASKNIRKRIFG
ncbi:MAG: hypothetical protein AAF402_00740 [Pseudomonadota bacterium]